MNKYFCSTKIYRKNLRMRPGHKLKDQLFQSDKDYNFTKNHKQITFI
jgi:hypothetical protein